MSDSVQAILSSLLAFDTTSREPNLAMINWIADFLTRRGISSRAFFDPSGQKANLYARIGPSGPGGLMLSGHTDVVPTDGQAWTLPPFQLTERDGRYYGRGSADMKGFLACVLASLDRFLEKPLNIPLHLAFSYDEEVGCLGVRSLVEHLRQADDRPAWCIIGEPTEMRPVYGHKGKLAMRCQVHGHACHSAYAPKGVNAIASAAKLITRLDQLGEGLMARQDPRFDPAWSTLQVGTIQGGSALNIVPEHCQFDFEIRYLPDDRPGAVTAALDDYIQADLLPAMRQVAPESQINMQLLSHYPGLLTDPASAFSRLLAQWCEHPDFSTVAFGTEGGLFNDAGMDVLICGPGSMEQGHKPDEYVTAGQLARCMAMLDNIRGWMQSSSGEPR